MKINDKVRQRSYTKKTYSDLNSKTKQKDNKDNNNLVFGVILFFIFIVAYIIFNNFYFV